MEEIVITLSMYLIRLDAKLSILSQWKNTRCLSSIQNF